MFEMFLGVGLPWMGGALFGSGSLVVSASADGWVAERNGDA